MNPRALVFRLLIVLVAPVALVVPASAQTPHPLELGVQVGGVRDDASGDSDVGIGARLAWHASDVLALEGTADFYPDNRGDVVRGGRKLSVLAGPKITLRSGGLGLFGKVRAGVARIGEGAGQGACIAIFPPPESCYEAENRLALDLGAGFDLSPTPRTVLRFEAGDLMVRGGRAAFSEEHDEIGHALQMIAGIGLRF